MCQWHDYHITGYRVDSEAQTLTLLLAWLYESGPSRPRAHLVFRGVEGYEFVHDTGIGVIACIGEDNLLDFLRRMESRFEEEKPWCWPSFWGESVDKTAAALQSAGVKCFYLDSALGVNGWIVAKRVDHHEPAPQCC